MIHTILSLFAFYELSSASRRLLQIPAQAAQPEYVPVPQTQATQAAQSSTTTTTTTRTGGVTLPFEATNFPQAAPPVLNCGLPYTSAGSCAGKIHSITNPTETFTVSCSATGSCTQSEIILNYLPGSPFVESIENVNFAEAWAGYKTTLMIDNQQGTNKVVLERLGCAKATSCNGLTVILINAHLNDLDCSSPSECQDCWIKQGPLDPNPKACYGW